MRKRLQKKLLAGPFESFGFELSGTLKQDTNPEKWLDDLIDFAEGNHFYFGGGFDPDLKIDLYIDCGVRKENPKKKYDMAINWIKECPEIESYKITPLGDINGRLFS